MINKLIVGMFFAFATCALGQKIPKGFTVLDSTLSPDHRYGITVPILDEHPDSNKSDDPHNSLIEMKTGRVLAVIQAYTGWDRMNHGQVLPSRWSPDGSLLLWAVDGKWSVDALVLLKINKGNVERQINVLKAGQQAILSHTKKAVPQQYSAKKKENAGNGSAYPEGFTINVEVTGPVSSPLHIQVELTSYPKPTDVGDAPTLDSHLEGTIDSEGNLTVTVFHLGRRHPSHFD